jgi:prophage regulatory protein
MSNDGGAQRAIRIIRIHDVTGRTGLSADQIGILERREKFPRRVPLSERAVGWLESEIEDWIAARVRLRDDATKAEQAKFNRSPPAVRARIRRELETLEDTQ